MELTPLSCVIIWLCGFVIFLQLRLVFLGHLALASLFVLRIQKSKVLLLFFKLLLDLDSVSVYHA